MAKEINTYETSIIPFEDCCTIFNPKNPKTAPHLDQVKKYEDLVDYQTLIDIAVNSYQVIRVDELNEKTSIETKLFD
jgi:thiamine biosynthesis protein ThiI